jgi:hypothetical protein
MKAETKIAYSYQIRSVHSLMYAHSDIVNYFGDNKSMYVQTKMHLRTICN